MLVFSTNNSSSNINNISLFGKGKYCFHGPNSKIVKLNITTKIKKLWLLAWDLATRISEGSKKSAIFLLSTWNFYLQEIIFVTDVGVLTIGTVSAVLFLKTLGCLYKDFEILERGTSAKKVTLRDAKGYVDKICKICTKLLRTQVENIRVVSHFNAKHLALWTTPKTLKESRKRPTSLKWATLTKSRIVPCQILSCFCQHSQLCLFHRYKTVTEFTNWIPKINGPLLLFKGAPSTSVHCGRALHRNPFAVIHTSRTWFLCLITELYLRFF